MSRWTDSKPPLGSQINWSHPLSKGLVGAWLMNEGAGSKIINLIDNTTGVLSNAKYYKNAILFSSASSVVTIDNSYLEKIYPNNYITVVSSIYLLGNGGGNLGRFIAIRGNSGNSYEFYRNDNINAIITSIGTSGTALQATGANNSILNNRWYHVVNTWEGLVTDYTSLKFYVNNKLIAYNADFNQNGTGTCDLSDNVLRIGNRADLTRNLNGYIKYTYIYNRVLSTPERKELYINPYQFIYKPRRVFYSIPEETPTEATTAIMTCMKGYW